MLQFAVLYNILFCVDTIITTFSTIKDKRVNRANKHKHIDIIMIAFCAVSCGAKSWHKIEDFGKSREAWLRRFLELPNVIPSHDTFGRTFAMLAPLVLEEKLMEWVQQVFV